MAVTTPLDVGVVNKVGVSGVGRGKGRSRRLGGGGG